MNIEDLRYYCLSLPQVEEKMPFGDDTLCFCVAGKIFLLIALDCLEFVNMKCNPDKAVELREIYAGISSGWHMNKKHWNSVFFRSDVDDTLFLELVRHSYNCVIASLPKKVRSKYEML